MVFKLFSSSVGFIEQTFPASKVDGRRGSGTGTRTLRPRFKSDIDATDETVVEGLRGFGGIDEGKINAPNIRRYTRRENAFFGKRAESDLKNKRMRSSCIIAYGVF